MPPREPPDEECEPAELPLLRCGALKLPREELGALLRWGALTAPLRCGVLMLRVGRSLMLLPAERLLMLPAGRLLIEPEGRLLRLRVVRSLMLLPAGRLLMVPEGRLLMVPEGRLLTPLLLS